MPQFVIFFAILCLLYPHFGTSQLTPRVDQHFHTNGVKLVSYSSNNELVAMFSTAGGITIQHVKTGKVLKRVKEGSKLIWMSFSEDDKQMYYIEKINKNVLPQSVYSNSTNDAYTDLLIGKINIHSGEDIQQLSPQLNSSDRYQKSWKTDLSGNHQYLSLLNTIGHLMVIDLHQKRVIYDIPTSEIKVAGFNQNNELQYLEKQNSSSTLQTLQLSPDIKITQSNLITGDVLLDGENKYALKSRDKILFQDQQKQHSCTLGMDASTQVSFDTLISGSFLIDDYIKDFNFNGNGELLAFTGGLTEGIHSRDGKSYKNLAIQVSGIVNCPNQELRWIKQGKESWQNIGRDIRFFEEGKFSVIDASGNHLIGETNEGEYIDIHAIDKTHPLSLDINDDLSEIHYSIMSDRTYKMELSSLISPIEVSPQFFRHVNVNKKDLMVGAYTFNFGEFESPSIFKNSRKLIFENPEVEDVNHLSQSNNHNSWVYTTRAINRHLGLVEQKVIENTSNYQNTTKLNTADGIYYCDYIPQQGSDYKSVELDKSNQIIFCQLNEIEQIEQTTILPSVAPDETRISSDGQFLTYTQALNEWNTLNPITSPTFDTKNNTWRTHPQNPTLHPTKTYFSIDTTLAVSIWPNKTIELWRTTNGSSIKVATYNKPASYEISINNSRKQIIIPVKDTFFVYNFDFEIVSTVHNTYCPKFSEMKFDRSGNYLNFSNLNTGKALLIDFESAVAEGAITFDQIIHEWKMRRVSLSEYKYNNFSSAYFHSSKDFVFLFNGNRTLEYWSLLKRKKLFTLELYKDGEWLAYDPNGYFDASPNARDHLYYTLGFEPLLFSQIKERFWEPGLVSSRMKNDEIQGGLSNKISLYPRITNLQCDTTGTIQGKLRKQSGGIGKVELYINGKQVADDINQARDSSFSIQLINYESYLLRNSINTIGFIAYNQEGWLGSRKEPLYIDTHLDRERLGKKKPKFGLTTHVVEQELKKDYSMYGIFVGNSKYNNPKLNLAFADKDAKMLMNAFEKVSDSLFNQNTSQFTTLTSDRFDNLKTSKTNFIREIKALATKAKAEDIIVIFLSGHGVTLDNDFYYLLPGAGNIALEKNDSLRNEVTISSSEIRKELKNIKSSKQMLIIDACHSGKVASLFLKDSKANSTSQEKALEQLKDKTGIYVIASSEANQKSYETNILGQGVLTFSLLDGMSGSAIASNQQIINVLDLFSFATRRVEELSRDVIGTTQRPVLGIADGANTFPIGIKNKSLKVELPQNKLKMGRPTFIQERLWNDPLHISNKTLIAVQNKGSLGKESPFFFTRNIEGDDLINISGVYIQNNSELNVRWNILKNQELWIEHLTTTGKVNDVNQVVNQIMNISEIEIKSKLKSE